MFEQRLLLLLVSLHVHVSLSTSARLSRVWEVCVFPSPALLQSTVKVFFWPTKALDRPAPLEMTLLASEENLGPKDPLIADDFVTVSTRTDDVSCKLWPPERRAPEEKKNKSRV